MALGKECLGAFQQPKVALWLGSYLRVLHRGDATRVDVVSQLSQIRMPAAPAAHKAHTDGTSGRGGALKWRGRAYQ